ncbi:Hcp family type VI secretion system effector [Variovorax paradoxus]|uniref:Hcp family type VI secretion system effector n=1 Tax=Variovorax paradoxus TaxID=34073 RepID=UPI002786EEAA|nr:type VI secretion system tube protein Hcp [Variovorax paradoxus]MDQ0588996.1 type VI secretion system secreted protein Hcp [Variovorax paradoxus]
MAADMFLKLEGVDGESKDDSHKKEIDVLAWSWGAAQSGTGHVGGGSGAGKVNVQDLSVTKYVDSASHLLLLDCCNGQHIKKGTLVVRKAGATPLEYIKLTMEDIIVSNVHTGGSGGEDRLTETITLNFSKFKYEYTPQKSDGSGDGTKETGWDIAANKKV